MNHRGWFTLVVRAIAIGLFGWSLLYAPGLVQTLVADVTEHWDESRMAAFLPALGRALLTYGGACIQLAFALYLFFGGKWIIDRCLADAGAERAATSGASKSDAHA